MFLSLLTLLLRLKYFHAWQDHSFCAIHLEPVRTKQGQSNMKQRYFTQHVGLGNSLLQDVTPAKAFTYIRFEKELILMKNYSGLFEYKDTTTVSGSPQATNGWEIGNCSGQALLHAGSGLTFAPRHLAISHSVGQNELERPLVLPTITSFEIRRQTGLCVSNL